MKGWIDLHSHFVPGVDDGVETAQEGVRLCEELLGIGFNTVVATPHVRAAMFDNSRSSLMAAYREFLVEAGSAAEMPDTFLAAEYFCNDLFWRMFEQGEVMPYPGGNAVLVEFPAEQIPIKVEERFFRMNIKGVRAMVAHPERHPALFRSTRPIEPALQVGALAQLDLMSLAGRHGSPARQAAERMLEEGVYYTAASDSHGLEDVEWAARGAERLEAMVGKEEAFALLSENPRRILDGDLE